MIREYPLAVRLALGTVCCVLVATAVLLRLPLFLAAAQSPAEWSFPVDISYPDAQGRDLAGALVCDRYQNLHILWGKAYEGGAAIYYRTDEAGRLSYPMDVVATAENLAIRLFPVITDSDARLHLIWENSYIGGKVLYASAPLMEAGTVSAWSDPVTLVDNAYTARLYADAEETLHLFYSVTINEGLQSTIYHQVSDDSGLSWGEPVVIYEHSSLVPSFLTMVAAFDEAGRVHLGITRRSHDYGVDSALGYMRSLDGAQSWEPYQVFLEQDDDTPNLSTITPFSFGADQVHLTWHDPRRMHTWSYDGGETWAEPVEIMPIGAGFGGANVLAMDSAGTLHVATGVKDRMFSATWDGMQWSMPETIDSRTMDPHGQKVVVCQGNQLHLVYDDRILEETTVWYAHKRVPAAHIAQEPWPEMPETDRAPRPAASTAPRSETVTPDQGDDPAARGSMQDALRTEPGLQASAVLFGSSLIALILLSLVLFFYVQKHAR